MKQEIHVKDLYRMVGVSAEHMNELSMRLIEETELGRVLSEGLECESLVDLMISDSDNVLSTFDRDSVCAGIMYNGMIIHAMRCENVLMRTSYQDTQDIDPKMN